MQDFLSRLRIALASTGASFAHILIALGVMGVVVLVAGNWFGVANAHWIGAAFVSGGYIGRELSQSFRKSDPGRVVIDWNTVREALWPTGVALALAGFIQSYAVG